MTVEIRNQIAQHYVAAFVSEGARSLIGNLDTTVRCHIWGEYTLPMTINDGQAGETFVCSPQIGYIDYPLEELSNFPNKAMVPALRALINGVGGVLSLCDINRIVHIDNWMISTNLPVNLDSSLTKRQTDILVEAHPTHLLAMRSLTWRYSANMMKALEAAGWVLLPSRQVFLLGDVTKQSLSHRDTRRDDKLLRSGEFSYEELTELSEADASRIVELYGMLYLTKYSDLNPAYTARFIALTHNIGMIRYLVFRDSAGIIQSFGGMYHSGQHATMPLIGYNTHLDRKYGLYRLAFHAGSLYAAYHKLCFNMSSGATAFKRNRGAEAELEFTAFHLRHLPASRRYPFEFLKMVAKHIGIPILRRYQL